jgi:rhodanese-related sulfurtransferase
MLKNLSFLLFVLILGFSGSCTTSDFDNRALTPELIDSGSTIVDIRTEAEWRETGVVPGSLLMTFFRPDRSYDLEGFIAKFSKHVDAGDDVALLCRRGNRSAKLAALLSKRGFTSITNITGGISRAGANGVQLVAYPAVP